MVQQEPDINQRIWQVVALIPRGRVATYGDIAARAGLPGAARRVGRALGRLPEDTRIPWHRVINARGRISLPPGSDAFRRQRDRLKAEGVCFNEGGGVSLARYRWQP